MNDEIMKKLFPEELHLTQQGNCPTCRKPINDDDFKDELSRKEYTISGMCQVCQDKVFGGGE
jgi:uncharacterized CHY-type Zn-finger protein